MQQLAGTASSFAALRSNGSVVTWGQAKAGGDSSRVQDQLRQAGDFWVSGGAEAGFLELGGGVGIVWFLGFCYDMERAFLSLGGSFESSWKGLLKGPLVFLSVFWDRCGREVRRRMRPLS